MEYTHVGRLGLVVSRLCLGTMNFGPHTSEEDSHRIMDAALAGEVWDWRPETPLEQILEEIALHAEQNPSWLELSETA